MRALLGRSARVLGVDVAPSLALIAMMAVHIWLLISSPHSGTTFDLAHSCGSSAAPAGGLWINAPGSPVGRRSLSPWLTRRSGR